MRGEIITAEDVRRGFRENYKYELAIGNGMGAIFADGQWECMGFTRAKRPEAHARMIRQWRLKKHALS
jgi:hypothetical protein